MKYQISSFLQMREVAKIVARKLKAEHNPIIDKIFPDKELYIKLKKDPTGKSFVLIESFAKKPNVKLIRAILASGAAKDSGAKERILIATYLPYMRQDTQFNSHESVSAKHILKTLSQHFDKIYVVDPHLHRIKVLHLLVKNARSITSNDLLAKYIKEKYKKGYTIVGPDKESFQWARKVAQLSENKAVVLKKKRFSAIKVKIKEEPLGKKVLIIDDIISTGRTILETINMARKQGAKKIRVVAIHGLFRNNSDKLIRKHASLATTNTVPNANAKIDISPLIVETLKSLK